MADATVHGCCNSSRLPGYIFLSLYLISSLAFAECAKITLSYIDRPYFVRYINSSMAIVLFLFPLYAKIKQHIIANRNEHSIILDIPLNNDNNNSLDESQNNTSIITGSVIHFLLYTIIGTILHTGGGFLLYVSLEGTTVPTALTLNKLKAIFVYILSVVFLKQIMSFWSCLAIITSFIGIFCYVFEVTDSKTDTVDTWWGCLASLSAAICWSILDIWTNITYKKYFPNSKYYGSILYEALIGFWTIFIFWFVIFVQQPIFEHNQNDQYMQWKWIIITGLTLTCTNVAFYVALNLTSPVFMNYAAFFVIPLSFILDIFVHDYKISILPLIGAFFIILGFVMLEIIGEPQWFKNMILRLRLKILGDKEMSNIQSMDGYVKLNEMENTMVTNNQV